MQIPVGYYIYIPDLYYQETQKNFRTVYYLHGGRPGNEARSVLISNFIDKLQESESLDSALYVFVNGGELSHYNSEELASFGEDVFIQEFHKESACTIRFLITPTDIMSMTIE